MKAINTYKAISTYKATSTYKEVTAVEIWIVSIMFFVFAAALIIAIVK